MTNFAQGGRDFTDLVAGKVSGVGGAVVDGVADQNDQMKIG
jgi:hypothetical protein